MALVRSKDSSKFRDVQSFSTVNSKVGFVRATTGEMAARTFFKSATLVPQPNANDGIAALRKGEIEVFIHDAPTVWRRQSQRKGTNGIVLASDQGAAGMGGEKKRRVFAVYAQPHNPAVADKWFRKTDIDSMGPDKNLVGW